MAIKSNFYFVLLASTILTQNANALTLNPTLNDLKNQGQALTSADVFTLTKLGTAELPQGAVKINVNGSAYYFTPSGDNKNLISILAGTPASVITEDANGSYNISFDTSKIPNSAFSYTTGSETDYNFTVQEADSEGNLTTKYYKIVLGNTQLVTSNNITFGAASDTEPTEGNYVTITLPNNKTKYFSYTYTKPENRTFYDTRQTSLSGNVDADFIGNYAISSNSYAYGGAIYNSDTIGNITGDFIGNYAISDESYANGGAIFNSGTIGNITGDFIGNYATISYELYANGGAIYNNGTIGNITGDFIGNYADYGGAIFNRLGNIGNITGDFIGNYANYGGAIYNSDTIGDITGDFIGNYVSNGYDRDNGGAIFNSGTIGNITGDFIGNYAISSESSALGGAIYNSETIGNITGDFIGNYASGDNYAYGGAIYNSETIGNITGDFIGNYAKYGSGGAIYNSDTIGDITGDFIGNYVSNGYDRDNGGAIFNFIGTIGNITGDFIGNYADYGGAIFNRLGNIGNITGDFIGNYANYGGAIDNVSDSIGDITGDFIGNYAKYGGGAIYNAGDNDYYYASGTIGDITGDFIGNHVSDSYAKGGAIYNSYTIGDITGDFIDNSGGAIYNLFGNIGDITGDFIGNSGSAIYNSSHYNMSYRSATIGDITGDFIGNSGSAIYNYDGTIGDITGDFIGNYAKYEGGAIYNNGTIGDITGDFIGNYDTGYSAKGGAIYNNYAYDDDYRYYGSGTIGNITGDFIGNYASGDNYAYGGAIATRSDMTFTSGKDAHTFSDNYTSDTSRGKNYNAIFVEIDDETETTPVVTFDTTGGGSWTINDNIEGGKYLSTTVDYTYQYDLAFIGNDTIDRELGTTTQYVAMNNAIINAENINVENTTLKFGSYQHENHDATNWNGKGKFIASLNNGGTENVAADSVTSLTLKNAVFDIANGYTEKVKLKGFSSDNSYLHIDVNPDNLEADKLIINGDVAEKTTNVIIHAMSNTDITDKGGVIFAQSYGDTTGTADSFKVFRVYGSPYMYEVVHSNNSTVTTQNGLVSTFANNTPQDNTWAVQMKNIVNPNYSGSSSDNNIKENITLVEPEVIVGISIPTVALTQKTGMVNSIKKTVTSDVRANHNLWIDTDYNVLETDSVVDIESKVWGIQAGSDLQKDINHNLGVFVSYRDGNYEMNGNGKHYFAIKSSKIDAKSYLGGLYYHYNKNHWHTFASVYGGVQKAEAKTYDGVLIDTDGLEFGASIEGGYTFNLNNNTNITPVLTAYYTQVNYDNAHDNIGKTYEYENIKQFELEAGIKLEYSLKHANIYIKPSIVQTFNDSDEIETTDLGMVDTLEDETLGRVEVGGNYRFNDNWSAYGWTNYTFGSNYNATSVGLGLNYNW